MQERPILFSGPLVRAILDGRKTQTRRLIRDARGAFWDHASWTPTVETTGIRWTTDGYESFMPLRCPYGVPGDRLWVRETWGIAHEHADTQSWRNQLDDARRGCPWAPLVYRASDPDVLQVSPWKPSIHMPRWASRLTLEVAEVRVERLQAITSADIAAEGLPADYSVIERPDVLEAEQREAFRKLWDSINSERAPWASNPWCVAFRRVDEKARSA